MTRKVIIFRASNLQECVICLQDAKHASDKHNIESPEYEKDCAA